MSPRCLLGVIDYFNIFWVTQSEKQSAFKEITTALLELIHQFSFSNRECVQILIHRRIDSLLSTLTHYRFNLAELNDYYETLLTIMNKRLLLLWNNLPNIKMCTPEYAQNIFIKFGGILHAIEKSTKRR